MNPPYMSAWPRGSWQSSCRTRSTPADALACSRRASTVALAGLVGSQLGQTLLSGGRDPLVSLAAVGSTAALAAIIQTPGVSQFFGCTPLGPVGWTIAYGSSVAGTTLGWVLGRTMSG